MTDIDNVSKKILDDAGKERDKILDEARKKASVAIEETEERVKEIHQSGKLRAGEKYREVLNIEVSRAKSELNQKILMYKIDLIEDVIDRVKKKLTCLGKKDYEKFLKKTLDVLSIDEGYYQIGSEETNIDGKMMESLADFKKVDGKPDFKKGIRIIKGKAEYNIAPDSLIDSNIDDIRMDVALYLFGKER